MSGLATASHQVAPGDGARTLSHLMKTLFHGEVLVDYGQAYVLSGLLPENPMGGAFPGQVNGLCGAASPGFLFLITGLHYGPVGFTVELHDEEPAMDDVWEDVVEVSFRPESDTVAVLEWGGATAAAMTLGRRDFRVRYSAYGMDRARQKSSRFQGDPELDRYLLQFWPAPPRADRVVREGSAAAAYWHRWARGLPLPPPPPTAEEIAEAERRAEREARERMERLDDELYWGGVRPSERLRALRANSYALVRVDRPLLDALEDVEPESLRAIARWTARRASDAAGLSSLEWVAPALAAVERGEALPPPFDDWGQAWARLLGDDVVVHNVHVRVEHADDVDVSPPIDRRAAAMPAIFAAADADPLRAAVNAVAAAVVTFGDDHARFLQDLRDAFPEVRS